MPRFTGILSATAYGSRLRYCGSCGSVYIWLSRYLAILEIIFWQVACFLYSKMSTFESSLSSTDKLCVFIDYQPPRGMTFYNNQCFFPSKAKIYRERYCQPLISLAHPLTAIQVGDDSYLKVNNISVISREFSIPSVDIWLC